MSNTLVIHPSDRSTDFLKAIYEDKGFDVITDPNIDRKKLNSEIKKHDNIIMMGHGTPAGLINPEFFFGSMLKSPYPYVIDKTHAELLKKKNTISIWCNSDKYYEINGISDGNLHTGMIISEVAEELYILNKYELDEDEILENMNLFAKAVRDSLEMAPEKMIENILSIYDGEDDVTQYNRKNIKLI